MKTFVNNFKAYQLYCGVEQGVESIYMYRYCLCTYMYHLLQCVGSIDISHYRYSHTTLLRIYKTYLTKLHVQEKCVIYSSEEEREERHKRIREVRKGDRWWWGKGGIGQGGINEGLWIRAGRVIQFLPFQWCCLHPVEGGREGENERKSINSMQQPIST